MYQQITSKNTIFSCNYGIILHNEEIEYQNKKYTSFVVYDQKNFISDYSYHLPYQIIEISKNIDTMIKNTENNCFYIENYCLVEKICKTFSKAIEFEIYMYHIGAKKERPFDFYFKSIKLS
jgi:hypothetical protein